MLIVTSLVLLGAVFLVRSLYPQAKVYYPEKEMRGTWQIQSIDTMKYSRDIAREKSHDTAFDAVIDRQVRAIAETGATHVAIATPYDEEFVPFLKRWVKAARAYGLKVWFRGNFSGWEGWFEYPKISREEHIQKTSDFIGKHPELFEDGDIFVSCPECENGGAGDPRQTGDTESYRAFLIRSEQSARQSFQRLGKNVTTNYFSMNGDVARLVMDDATSKSLGNTVTIDHYVATPERLVSDVHTFGRGGRSVILGEFGTPIPDIHGTMTEDAQAHWLDRALSQLSNDPNVSGLNYWLSVGGSTELWSSTGRAKKAVAQITKYFRPGRVSGFVRDDLGRAIGGARVSIFDKQVQTDRNGYFNLSYISAEQGSVEVSADGYVRAVTPIAGSLEHQEIALKPKASPWYHRALVFFRSSVVW